MRDVTAVDLFCGAGGLTYGLQRAGIDVVAGIDVDEQCRFAFEENTDGRFLPWDLRETSGDGLLELYPDKGLRVLVGCAPCQPFSQFTQGRDTKHDVKWSLLKEFSRLAREAQPDVVSMENVPKLRSHEVFDDFVRTLREELGYSVWYDQVHAPKYGVPQDRKRLVLLASRLGQIQLEDPLTSNPEDFPTVRDAIGHLPEIEAGGDDPTDAFHRSAGLGDTNFKRMRHSEPGGTWRDWPENLRLECHKKTSGSSYVGVYGRMEWDEPAPTLTTQFFNYGSGRFGHPVQDRAISLREGALLQTFPEDYQFVSGDKQPSKEHAGQMIGNAVPVELAKAIGRSIRRHLERHASDGLLQVAD